MHEEKAYSRSWRDAMKVSRPRGANSEESGCEYERKLMFEVAGHVARGSITSK